MRLAAQKLAARFKQRYVPPYEIARLYSDTEDQDQTLRWLQTAYEQREARLSIEGEIIETPETHLYSVGGFLDDTWWHRYYMLYGTRFKNGPGGGLGRSGGAPYGRLLVCDDEHVYGYGRKNRNQYHLFCRPKVGPKMDHPESNRKEGLLRNRPQSLPPAIWTDDKFPIMVRAMALTGPDDGSNANKRLILAGPRVAALRSIDHLKGDEGGLLAIIDAETGKQLSKIAIESTPVLDGMCVARGTVVASLVSGAVAVFK